MSKRKTTIQNHKTDLRIRSYYFSIRVIKFLDKQPYSSVNKIIFNQVLRSVTSIGANIIEAKSSSSKRDFIKFYQISLKSANESKYWFGLLRDAVNLNNNEINTLLSELEEISNMLAASVLTMKNKKF